MASTDAQPIPKKNTAYRHYFAIRSNTGGLVTTWAGQDSERSLDGASFADATNEATEIGTSGCGFIDLTAAEMNTDATVLKVSLTNAGSLDYVVTFFPESLGDIRTSLGGAGSITYIVTVKSSGSPVAGVECWVTTDVAGTNVVAGTLTTDDFGIVTFLLEAGTYYLWRDSATHSFPKPTTITVS